MSEPEKKERSTEGLAEFVRSFRAGEVIFREGDAGEVMFIVQKGEVAILKEEPRGPRILSRLEEGDFFGETGILEDLPRVTSARAETDCEVFEIDRATFGQIVRYNPEVPIRMLRKLSRRLREVLAAKFRQEGSAEMPVAPILLEETATQPAEPVEPVTQVSARFVHVESGTEFPLSREAQTVIGRFDRVAGYTPDVELRSVDPQRTTSRRHARVVRREGSFFLIEEVGAANGTAVNGTTLAAGVEVELHEGDAVRIGQVELVFRVR